MSDRARGAGMGGAGTLFFIVGPSGAGKDSLINGIRPRLQAEGFIFARRVITRAAGAGGEDHETCGVDEFLQRERQGDFLASWRAHGLHYGIPARISEHLAAGRHVIANGSRGAAAGLAERVPAMVVVEVDAPASLLAERLAARARESADDIARRIARPAVSYPEALRRVRIVNDRDLQTGVLRLEGAIKLQLGVGSAAPRGLLLRKLGGGRLDDEQWASLLGSVISHQITGDELRAMLIACAAELDDRELLSVARWRAGLMPRISWGNTPVVDKHSLGGTAGSRVTMVVIPIVAAHGMIIPKTSSRAITSAAGTADAMEVLARVDLNAQELQATVHAAKACIAWNGRLNHSILDEAMHRAERELGLDTRRWSVASILSKKWSAGSTHVVVDIPYMPGGKVPDFDEAAAVARVFEAAGAAMGMVVRAFPSDGSAPIGRGIGPALEARDVMQVLDGHADAPADLREKSIFFAGQILAFDPTVGSAERGCDLARQLLHSGAARRAMQAIIDAQGPRPAPDESQLKKVAVTANVNGRILGIDARRVSAIARAAGAPADALAGVDLACRVGDAVTRGDLLYRIQARDSACLELARHEAARASAVRIGPPG